ncbi:MAG: AraC family transcriptional regulator [Paludibacteraceae bacterium]|nr:AraC family transcriptional regulator [Paludibacteraceae bacterium]
MRNFWLDYRSEVLFLLLLLAVTSFSTWFGQFIDADVYDDILTPVFNTATVIASLCGAWILLRHSNGMRTRIFFAYALIVWGLSDLIYLIGWAIAPHRVMDMAAHELTTYELVLGNLLGWVLLLYPTEALRPGWMNWKRAFLQLLPLAVLATLDDVLPCNLWPVIALYPYILLALLFGHIRAYRKWCEDNFSSLDDIDVRWIIRYSIMLFIVGLNYIWMCSTHYHTRGFTQQWFVVLMFIYATEQILFRQDPWREVQRDDVQRTNQLPTSNSEASNPQTLPNSEALNAERRLFEQWMETEKPYLNPNFQLTDLRTVLPMNRTYLSQFINTHYACSFFQLVNRYRIEEAKQLMTVNPDMKLSEIASRSGFSSPAVFSRTFARETGLSPVEWRNSRS